MVKRSGDDSPALPLVRPSDVAMWSVGLDWVRLTLNSDMYGMLAGAREMYRTAAIRIARQAGYTGEGEPWSMRGYKGEKFAQSGWGENYHSGLMYDVSGWMADYAYDLPLVHTGVPRLDIQITLWMVTDIPELARRAADVSELASRKVAHRPWKIRLTETRAEGGSTVYLGERKESAVFIRIYDKMREAMSKGADASEWRYAWRFEIELKENEGYELFQLLRATTQKDDLITQWVGMYLRRRGIVLPNIKSGAVKSPIIKEDIMEKNDRRLAWLNRYVAPTIDKMRSGGVSLERIVSALELE